MHKGIAGEKIIIIIPTEKGRKHTSVSKLCQFARSMDTLITVKIFDVNISNVTKSLMIQHWHIGPVILVF